MEELKRRGLKSDNCPRCNTSGWTLDLIEMSARSAQAIPGGQLFPRSATYDQAGGFIALLGFTCKNCGYALFHDLSVLGV
jgi:predicted nucleic-acid-binding Zn-ribbon protein